MSEKEPESEGTLEDARLPILKTRTRSGAKEICWPLESRKMNLSHNLQKEYSLADILILI